MGKTGKDEKRGSDGRAGLGGGILCDTHDGREAQPRLTEREGEKYMERWGDAEQRNSRTAEQQKEARRIEKADEGPLLMKYAGMPQAVGCEMWSGW